MLVRFAISATKENYGIKWFSSSQSG